MVKKIIDIPNNIIVKEALGYNFTNEEQWQNMVSAYRHLKLLHCDQALNRRALQLKDYLIKWGIKSVVVGVSGGLDSAVVLGMLENLVDAGIDVYAVNITYNQYPKAMSFDSQYMPLLRERFPTIYWRTKDLSSSMDWLTGDMGLDYVSDQVDNDIMYALRYQALFAMAKSVGGVTIGTTNLDECGYVGWFGKNSDMMVDIQPIMDMHKFELRRWAKLLNIPSEIIERAPTGDLPTGITDEEAFGVDYDSLSLYTAMKLSSNYDDLGGNDFINKKFEKVIGLHLQNLHKYQGQQYNPYRILQNVD